MSRNTRETDRNEPTIPMRSDDNRPPSRPGAPFLSAIAIGLPVCVAAVVYVLFTPICTDINRVNHSVDNYLQSCYIACGGFVVGLILGYVGRARRESIAVRAVLCNAVLFMAVPLLYAALWFLRR